MAVKPRLPGGGLAGSRITGCGTLPIRDDGAVQDVPTKADCRARLQGWNPGILPS